MKVIGFKGKRYAVIESYSIGGLVVYIATDGKCIYKIIIGCKVDKGIKLSSVRVYNIMSIDEVNKALSDEGNSFIGTKKNDSSKRYSKDKKEQL